MKTCVSLEKGDAGGGARVLGRGAAVQRGESQPVVWQMKAEAAW